LNDGVCLFFAVLEYAEGGWIFEGSGPTGGIGEAVSQRYLRDVVAGLMYLHQHVGFCFTHHKSNTAPV